MHKKQFENDGKSQQNHKWSHLLHSPFHEHSRRDEPIAIAPTTVNLLPRRGQSQHRPGLRESLQRVFNPTW